MITHQLASTVVEFCQSVSPEEHPAKVDGRQRTGSTKDDVYATLVSTFQESPRGESFSYITQETLVKLFKKTLEAVPKELLSLRDEQNNIDFTKFDYFLKLGVKFSDPEVKERTNAFKDTKKEVVKKFNASVAERFVGITNRYETCMKKINTERKDLIATQQANKARTDLAKSEVISQSVKSTQKRRRTQIKLKKQQKKVVETNSDDSDDDDEDDCSESNPSATKAAKSDDDNSEEDEEPKKVAKHPPKKRQKIVSMSEALLAVANRTSNEEHKTRQLELQLKIEQEKTKQIEMANQNK